jgi:hypothetical protein
MPVPLNLGPEVAQFLFDRSRGPEIMSGDVCNVPWNEEAEGLDGSAILNNKEASTVTKNKYC